MVRWASHFHNKVMYFLSKKRSNSGGGGGLCVFYSNVVVVCYIKRRIYFLAFPIATQLPGFYFLLENGKLLQEARLLLLHCVVYCGSAGG